MRQLPLLSVLSLFAICAWLFAERENHPARQGLKPPLSSSERSQAAQARETLAAWQEQEPVPSARSLKVVYWTPSDRAPAAGHRERLTRIMDHIQDFYRSEMERLGFGALAFSLEKESDGLLKVYSVKGQKPFENYERKSGAEIRRECLPVLRAAGMQPNEETLLIFCNLATWDEEKLTFRHQSPYYASGSHRGGTAWQLDSPELDIPSMLLKEPLIRDGEYGKISLGKHNSIFIGGIAHELGHALSLPHNQEAPLLRKSGHRALMGDGNRAYGDELRGEGPGAFLTFAGALRLASQPLFSKSEKALLTHAQASLQELVVEPGARSFRFSGRLQANVPVYGMVAYLDAEGRGDYDAQTVTAVPDSEGRFTLDCHYLTPGKAAQLRIVLCHVNGATSRQNYSYAVKPDGTPVISTLQTRFALDPIIKALNARDHSKLQPAFDSLHAQIGPGRQLNKANRIAKTLVESFSLQEKVSPAQVAADERTIALSATLPVTAEVGYGRPVYDRLPNSSLLLEADNKLFAHGIYAHAPALHRYELGKMWGKLSGKCALADGFEGSSVFIIRVDGKEVYRSPIAHSGKSYPFEVDLTDANSLELITTDAGDGRGSDWATWLEPTLKR